MNDDNEIFVSRHGRRTTLNDVDLGQIDIEKQSSPVAPKKQKTKPEPQVTKEPKFQFPKPERKPLSKKTWIIIGTVVLAIILVPLLLFEVITLQYNRNASTIKSDTARIAKTIALPEQKKSQLSADGIEKTLTALRKVHDDACKGGMLDNVARLYPRSSAALQNCTSVNGQLSELINSLESLNSIHVYSLKVDAILKPALAASDSPYAVIPDQVATWQTATDKLKAVNAPNELKTLHSSIVQVVGDIATQWSVMNTANNAQDAEGFNQAESKLGSFYETLRDQSSALVSAQQTVQTDISKQASIIIP